MLRFFRTLRRKLIEEDNIRKYIWYAVGEVLLVVIGILIALQINNWNEERKLDDLTESYLIQLLAETEYNVSYLGSTYDNHKRLIDISNKSAEILENGIMPAGYDSAFVYGIQALGFYTSIQPLTTVYEEAIRVGVIQNIQNDTLRLAINSFISQIDNFSDNLDYFRNTYDDPLNYALDDQLIGYDPNNYIKVSSRVNLNNLVKNKAYKTKVNMGLRNAIVFQTYRFSLVRSAEFMCDILAKELEASCSPEYVREGRAKD